MTQPPDAPGTPTSPPPSSPPSGPPPSLQPPASPPSGGSRRSRVPWVVAAVAVLVALAAVAALVVVLVGGGGDDAERGFDSPEEAVTHLVESLAEGDTDEAAAAFAVEPLVEGFSFEAQAERLRVVQFQTWLPGSSDGYDEINERVRRGEVAVELRSLVRNILAPERDLTTPATLDDDLTAADLEEEVSPGPLSELSVARVDEIDRSEESYTANLEEQAKIYGADELRMVGVLYDTAEGRLMGGATLVRYDDEWAIMSLTAPLLDIPVARLVPTSEEDYLDAVDSARGSDD